jgi:hypothetical protein
MGGNTLALEIGTNLVQTTQRSNFVFIACANRIAARRIHEHATGPDKAT